MIDKDRTFDTHEHEREQGWLAYLKYMFVHYNVDPKSDRAPVTLLKRVERRVVDIIHGAGGAKVQIDTGKMGTAEVERLKGMPKDGRHYPLAGRGTSLVTGQPLPSPGEARSVIEDSLEMQAEENRRVSAELDASTLREPAPLTEDSSPEHLLMAMWQLFNPRAQTADESDACMRAQKHLGKCGFIRKDAE